MSDQVDARPHGAIPGLMQQTQLLTTAILRHAERSHPRVPLVSRMSDGSVIQTDYAAFAATVRKAARRLLGLGVQAGDRVATLAWNTSLHMELFYAVPGIGAVLHTVNPRLFQEQLAYVINHGGARILLVDSTILPLYEQVRSQLLHVETILVLDGSADEYPALCEQPDNQDAGEFQWPSVDENAGPVLCYTSGTTGNPKGVLYSHRSIVLHALASGLSGTMNLGAFDVVMPGSSLYHATGWGLPFTALVNGCGLVLPGARLDAVSLHEMIVDHGVTMAAGVPTIWTAFLEHVESTGLGVGRLGRVLIGGTAIPQPMFTRFKALGVSVLQLWGMTETSPTGVASTPTAELRNVMADQADRIIRERQGRRVFGVELEIFGEDGSPIPQDGETPGSLRVKGPWVVQRYYKEPRDAVDVDGWFDTGDIATIDPFGFVRLTDRAKDMIKSGGEWISSIDLEASAMEFPGVRLAAAIGVPHPRWDERPILVVECESGQTIEVDALNQFLATRVARWWLPDRIIFAAVPLTATAKPDKRALRTMFAGPGSGLLAEIL